MFDDVFDDFLFCKQYHFESIIAMSCYVPLMSRSYRKKEGAPKCKQLMVKQGLAEATASDYWTLVAYVADDLKLATYKELIGKNAKDLVLSRIRSLGIDSLKALKFYKAFNSQKLVQELSMILLDDVEMANQVNSLIKNLSDVKKGITHFSRLKEIENDLIALRACIDESSMK
jgi:hypothetical protein